MHMHSNASYVMKVMNNVSVNYFMNENLNMLESWNWNQYKYGLFILILQYKYFYILHLTVYFY